MVEGKALRYTKDMIHDKSLSGTLCLCALVAKKIIATTSVLSR
jgi:hypothetical protein